MTAFGRSFRLSKNYETLSNHRVAGVLEGVKTHLESNISRKNGYC